MLSFTCCIHNATVCLVEESWVRIWVRRQFSRLSCAPSAWPGFLRGIPVGESEKLGKRLIESSLFKQTEEFLSCFRLVNPVMGKPSKHVNATVNASRPSREALSSAPGQFLTGPWGSSEGDVFEAGRTLPGAVETALRCELACGKGHRPENLYLNWNSWHAEGETFWMRDSCPFEHILKLGLRNLSANCSTVCSAWSCCEARRRVKCFRSLDTKIWLTPSP